MKKIMPFLKTLSFLFGFLFANSIYSQGACGAGYGFTYTNPPTTTCNYVFVPFNLGFPTVTSYEWIIESTGAYRQQCEDINNAGTLNYQFCFSGNHDVTLIFHFNGGGTCFVTQTVNVSCTGALPCDPNPATANIPDPEVEITYVRPETTCGVLVAPKSGCMYTYGGGHCNNTQYCISCGWEWNIRIVPSIYNCEIFTYKLEYLDVDGCPMSSSVNCITPLTPGQNYCFKAEMNQQISIVAYGNHCCVPAGPVFRTLA